MYPRGLHRSELIFPEVMPLIVSVGLVNTSVKSDLRELPPLLETDFARKQLDVKIGISTAKDFAAKVVEILPVDEGYSSHSRDTLSEKREPAGALRQPNGQYIDVISSFGRISSRDHADFPPSAASCTKRSSDVTNGSPPYPALPFQGMSATPRWWLCARAMMNRRSERRLR